MADGFPDYDRDSAFGDDDDFFTSLDSMFPTPAVAGTKRDAAALRDEPSGLGPSVEHQSEHAASLALCCDHCPESCPDAGAARPSKRRASALKVSEYHHSLPGTDTDCQFPDDCFEKFCQECNLEAACPPACASPCPSVPGCTPEPCWDPNCDKKEAECADGCVDPDCTKSSCPEQPCFCQKCDAQPCPLGEPNSQCHFAHTAPTTAGTIYCYDNAPCHFQEGAHQNNNTLASYETYPCFSQTHNYAHADDVTTQASNAPTPALSHSAYTSLDSTFTGDLSSPDPSSFSNCFLNVAGDHCHIDNTCCHGPKRGCGEFPAATAQQLDLWNTSTAQGNNLSNNLMNFDFSSHSTTPASASFYNNNMNNTMLGFNDNSWMYVDPSMANGYQPDMLGVNKLDFLASAIQQDFLKSTMNGGMNGGTNTMDNNSNLDGGASANTADAQCVCRWQLAPGILCLAAFSTAEALHKHTKSAHVDNCASCFCQWETCEASAKDFKQRSKLSRHLLGHAGYRPYACSFPECTKTFATNQAKDNHERTHTGERPYVCDRCGYTTTTHTQLQTHISALHEGKKPHKCRFCDFTCADSSNLSKHERTHQTLRPYRCPHAGCTFKPDCRWENLKRHLRRSGHCPELLEEKSEDYTQYREGVRREIEEWHRINGDGGVGKTGRRKSKA